MLTHSRRRERREKLASKGLMCQKFTSVAFRARDASQKRGLLRELVTSDGRVFGLFGPQEEKDAAK